MSYDRFKQRVDAWVNLSMEPGETITYKGFVDPETTEKDPQKREAIIAARQAAANRSSLRITSLDNGRAHRVVDIVWVSPSLTGIVEPPFTAQLQIVDGEVAGGTTRRLVAGEAQPRDETITATTLNLIKTFPHDRLAARGLLDITYMEWESAENGAQVQ
jgi:hypothetical protein